MRICHRFLLCAALLGPAAVAAQAPWTSTQYPQDTAKWWWDDGGWERGRLPAAVKHEVSTRQAAFASGDVEVPVLVSFGEHEQTQRDRPTLAGIESLQKMNRDARVIVYPGVGRGFHFRPPEVRSFADDLAAQDAARRTADFIRRHLR